MGEESDRAKALASIKEYVERRLNELKKEVSTLEKLKSFIDEELAGLSFKKAVEVKPVRQAEIKAPPREVGRARVLRARTGEVLARVITSSNEVRFVIEPSVSLARESRPFQSFLLRKVLDAMSKSDKERVEKGLIPPGHELEYDVVYDGDRVREIIVRNFREEYRVREIVNAVRWTLETALSETR